MIGADVFTNAAFVEAMDEGGVVLCCVPAAAHVDALRLHLDREDARRCWSLRLIGDDGVTLSELPTRHAFEVHRFAAALIERFEGDAA